MPITALLGKLGIDVANVTAPMNATPADLVRLGDADFNVVLYPEVAGQAASWLHRTFGQPFPEPFRLVFLPRANSSRRSPA